VLNAEGEVCAQAASFEEDLIVFDTATGQGELHLRVQGPDEASLHALILGTRDYVNKCGFRSAVVGLSGGIDSSLVAALAVKALGRENVLGVGMPGPYSSPGSLSDARQLAANLGIEFLELPITAIFKEYLEALRTVFVGQPVNVTEENIQARIRGNLLMALSNKFGSLVLSTGNKSELAVGYCTLYGDMAGGLAVISDIPKTMVYRLAELVNRNRPVIPKAVLEKAPSAELRPNQKDSDSLPAYEVLDVILKAYVEDHEPARAISEKYGLDLGLVRSVTARVDGN
jgi:NAD+ synthetase